MKKPPPTTEGKGPMPVKKAGTATGDPYVTVGMVIFDEESPPPPTLAERLKGAIERTGGSAIGKVQVRCPAGGKVEIDVTIRDRNAWEKVLERLMVLPEVAGCSPEWNVTVAR